MTDRIYATYTPTTAPGTYHTTIHYERIDPAGNVVRHVTIEAKPEKLEYLSASDKAIGVVEEAFRKDAGPSRFGRIDAHVEDRKPGDVPDAPYEMIAEGDDLSANLARMRLFAHAVNGAGFAYRGDRQNSNSFAGGALRAGELPPATGVAHDPAGPAGELLEFFAPGLNEPLRAPIGPRREPREVARRWFDERFGEWGSVPAGAALPPAAGDPDKDSFGNWGSFPAAGSGDTRSPVLHALEKFRRSSASDGQASASAQGALPATPAFQPDFAGTGGVLGKFMGDRPITPVVAVSSSLPLLPGPTAPNLASEESAFGDQSENAPDTAPRPDTYPQLRRVSSAFPGITPRDADQSMPPEPIPLLGILSGKAILPLPPEFWRLPDKSGASSNGALFDFLAGLSFQHSAPLAPDDEPRGFDRGNQAQPRFI